MKYIKLFEKFNNKQLDNIADIVLELKDDGFSIDIKHYDNSLQINISININDLNLGEFHFSRIEDTIKRLIDYLNNYKFTFIAYDLKANVINNSNINELSNKNLIYFQLFFE